MGAGLSGRRIPRRDTRISVTRRVICDSARLVSLGGRRRRRFPRWFRSDRVPRADYARRHTGFRHSSTGARPRSRRTGRRPRRRARRRTRFEHHRASRARSAWARRSGSDGGGRAARRNHPAARDHHQSLCFGDEHRVRRLVRSSANSPTRRRRSSVRSSLAGRPRGISATFNAPIGGVFFASEVILGDFAPRSFATIVVSSVIAAVISRAYLGNRPSFSSRLLTRVAARTLALCTPWRTVCAVGVGFRARALRERGPRQPRPMVWSPWRQSLPPPPRRRLRRS